MLRFHFFGTFEIFDSEGQLLKSKELSGKCLSLIKFLVAHRGQPFTKDQLTDTIYEEKIDEMIASEQQLKMPNILPRITEARSALEPQKAVAKKARESKYILRVGKGTYSFSDDVECWIDVYEFDERYEAGRHLFEAGSWSDALQHLTEASKLYRGHFLTEDSDESWVALLQSQYKEKAVGVFVCLARCEIQLGKFESAVAWAERARENNELNQDALICQLEALVFAHRPDAAVELSVHARDLYEREGLPLTDSLKDLMSRIESGESLEPPSPQVRHNLSEELNSFVGRESELEAIENALIAESRRLVTITGMGGSGKSRLAIRAARNMIAAFPDGVWLIELAAITTEEIEHLDQHVSKVLEIQNPPDRPIRESLCDALESQTALIVLDNCEQIREGCSKLVTALLQSCPHLKILVTSREPLGVAGEWLDPLDMLPLPDSSKVPFHTMRSYAAIELFLDRAENSQGEHIDDPANAELIFHICKRLDGIPLAIELAAGGVGPYSLEIVHEMLEDKFRLYFRSDGSHPERHETLWAAFNFSFDLLNPEEQEVFCTLSTFGGSFGTGAGAAVCQRSKTSLMSFIRRLHDTSFVRREGNRYRISESLREFGTIQLERLGIDDEVYQRMIEHFVETAQQASESYKSQENIEILDDIAREYTNYRMALQEAFRLNRVEDAIKISNLLYHFWLNRGQLDEGVLWLGRILENAPPTSDSELWGWARYHYGWLQFQKRDLEGARQELEKAVEIWEKVGEHEGLARTLSSLGVANLYSGAIETAKEQLEKALPMAQSLEIPEVEAAIWGNLGILHFSLGELDRTVDCFDKNREIAQSQNDRIGLAKNVENLGSLYWILGFYDKSLNHFEQAIELYEEIGDENLASQALLNSGRALEALSLDAHPGFSMHGEADLEVLNQARDRYEQALERYAEADNHYGAIDAAIKLGSLNFQESRFDEAIAYVDDALSDSDQHGYSSLHVECLALLSRIYQAAEKSDEALSSSNQAMELLSESGVADQEEIKHAYFKALQGTGNEEEATALLQEIQFEFKKRADLLGDEKTRDSFLKSVRNVLSDSV